MLPDCADGPGMEAECVKGSAEGKCESNIIWAYTNCAATCDLCPSRFFKLQIQCLNIAKSGTFTNMISHFSMSDKEHLPIGLH